DGVFKGGTEIIAVHQFGHWGLLWQRVQGWGTAWRGPEASIRYLDANCILSTVFEKSEGMPRYKKSEARGLALPISGNHRDQGRKHRPAR
ncbi:hypothetical protein P3W85_44810, partial [Cupriavidus basilensis]